MLLGNLVHAVESVIDNPVPDALGRPAVAQGGHLHAGATALIPASLRIVGLFIAEVRRRKLGDRFLAPAPVQEQGHQNRENNASSQFHSLFQFRRIAAEVPYICAPAETLGHLAQGFARRGGLAVIGEGVGAGTLDQRSVRIGILLVERRIVGTLRSVAGAILEVDVRLADAAHQEVLDRRGSNNRTAAVVLAGVGIVGGEERIPGDAVLDVVLRILGVAVVGIGLLTGHGAAHDTAEEVLRGDGSGGVAVVDGTARGLQVAADTAHNGGAGNDGTGRPAVADGHDASVNTEDTAHVLSRRVDIDLGRAGGDGGLADIAEQTADLTRALDGALHGDMADFTGLAGRAAIAAQDTGAVLGGNHAGIDELHVVALAVQDAEEAGIADGRIGLLFSP